MLKKIICLIVLSVVSLSVYAEGDNPWLKTSEEKLLKKPFCIIDLEKKTFIKTLNQFKNSIENGMPDGKPLDTVSFKVYAKIVNGWLKTYKYIEIDTNISKAWFKKIAKYFMLMYKYSKAMDIAEKKNDDKAFDAAQKKYNQYVDAYIEAIKKPEKPSRKRKEYLEVEKIKQYKAYKAYLRKKREQERGKKKSRKKK